MNQRSPISELLDRPDEQRLREYKYRFAQAVVFGLPVIGLQLFGLRLGGDEAAVWVGLLQAVLAGWVWYVAAAGMMLEGFIRRSRKLAGDVLIAATSVLLYATSAIGLILLIANTGAIAQRLFWFHVVVLLLIVWCGLQWWRWSRKLSLRPSPQPSPRGGERE